MEMAAAQQQRDYLGVSPFCLFSKMILLVQIGKSFPANKKNCVKIVFALLVRVLRISWHVFPFPIFYYSTLHINNAEQRIYF
jgi:hypothetical protein